jgi:hypothetical protein
MDAFKTTDVQMVLPDVKLSAAEQRRLAKAIDDALWAMAFPPAPPPVKHEPPCPDCTRMGAIFVGCSKHMIS